MSVTLNPEALLAIQRGEGVLGEAIRRNMEGHAERLVGFAAEEAREVITTMSEEKSRELVVSDTSVDADGLRADIGVTRTTGASDTWFKYLDDKAASRESQDNWLLRALTKLENAKT